MNGCTDKLPFDGGEEFDVFEDEGDDIKGCDRRFRPIMRERIIIMC